MGRAEFSDLLAPDPRQEVPPSRSNHPGDLGGVLCSLRQREGMETSVVQRGSKCGFPEWHRKGAPGAERRRGFPLTCPMLCSRDSARCKIKTCGAEPLA
jgi:hypothetical protein